MAETRCKYYKQKRQVSYDGGQTWQDVIPYQYQKGDLYEYESADCGAVIVYRWVNMDPSTDYYCEGTVKYYKQKRQVSYDGGQTWNDVSPAEYQEGGVAEAQSTDCGYVPPTPTGNKLVANYSDGKINEVYCNGDGTLTSSEVNPSGYEYSAMTSAVVGDCCTKIGDLSFSYCRALTSLTISNSVTTIGNNAFLACTGLKRVNSNVDGVCNIPNNVTKLEGNCFHTCLQLVDVTIGTGVEVIGEYAFDSCRYIRTVYIASSIISEINNDAFAYCGSLESITINAPVPPRIGVQTFGFISDFNIYVPASSVDAYKSAQYWSQYASYIQPIP